MTTLENIPPYLDQTPDVAARFQRLVERPVALEVKGLTKRFESSRGAITALENLSISRCNDGSS